MPKLPTPCKVHARYNEYGYGIFLEGREEPVYVAGNNPVESSSIVPLSDALPLEKIEEYADGTMAGYVKDPYLYDLPKGVLDIEGEICEGDLHHGEVSYDKDLDIEELIDFYPYH